MSDPTPQERLAALRPKLTPEFLATLVQLGGVYVRTQGDFQEILEFIAWSYQQVGLPAPDLEPDNSMGAGWFETPTLDRHD